MREFELLFVGFLLSATDANCPLTLDPPTVVVKYGDPVEVVCTVTDDHYIEIGWEARQGFTGSLLISSSPNVTWSVSNLTNWQIPPECYINPPRGSPKKQCSKKPRVVVYDVPGEVHLSSTRPVVREDQLVPFTCSVNSSVPFTNLTVILHVNDNPHQWAPQPQSRHVQAVFQFLATKEANGARVKCEALIDLKPEGPEISKFSNEQILHVYYEPVLTCPLTYSVPEDTPYNLTCAAEGNPPPQIVWYKDGDEVELPENLTRSDAGQYLVVASNALNQTANATVEVIVTYPPSEILELEDSEVEVGSSVRLKCSSTANPRPQYSWTYYRADNVVEWNEDGVSHLLVENATGHNMGLYTCHAGNERGNVSKNARLTVKGTRQECPVEMVPERLLVRYKEKGQQVTCRPTTSSSMNLEHIFWEVPPGVIVHSRDWSANQYWEDWEQKPVCHARFKGLGSCTKLLNFTLYKTPDSVSLRSVLTLDAAGRPVNTLVCDIENVAPAKNLVVRWYHGNETLQPSHIGGVTLRVRGCESNSSSECSVDSSVAPVNVSASARLHLNRTRDLMGIRCGALLDLDLLNQPEVTKSDPLNITAYYKPVINTTKLPKTIPVFQGYPEDLECEADGHPPPEIHWSYSSDKVERLSGVTIRVREPGVYNCSATNALDSTSHQVVVIMKEDYLPLIAGLVAVTVVIISVIFVFIYSIYYTNTKMRRYSLKNPKLSTHNGNVAHNGWDLPMPMTKLS